ncbi:protein FAR1-RELATED SEQUENCE 5-like [Silene latifolia]|uniref:protein FAR1-RELATED SEQUENCE 5-like n=1 Tax=Silene latifolia TaxID=37657 RepID=UPI003D77B3EA
MFKEYVKGYRNVGASLEDFKNYWRDVKQFIKGYDAQMMIENFIQKKAMCSSYFYDFDVDDRGRLSRGVDHHKKCVTFGGGLIREETDDDFIWLFWSFLTAMSDKYHLCVITDQDRGIKAGVKTVFGDKTQHRYCIWHIMKILPEKIGTTLYKETNFMKELCSCVWAEDIERAKFEERWCSIVSSYDYPAINGLLRCLTKGLPGFQHISEICLKALWTLRDGNSRNYRRVQNSFPILETPHSLEKHASEFYTPFIFSEFQNEWKAACFTCGVKVVGISQSDIIPILDRERHKVHYVSFISNGVILNCSCKKFERHGILCRHTLYVLKEQGFEKVPTQYLLGRWSKLATCQPIFTNVHDTLIDDCNALDVRKNKIGTIWSEVFSGVTLAEQKPDYVDDFMVIIKGFKEKKHDWYQEF